MKTIKCPNAAVAAASLFLLFSLLTTPSSCSVKAHSHSNSNSHHDAGRSNPWNLFPQSATNTETSDSNSNRKYTSTRTHQHQHTNTHHYQIDDMEQTENDASHHNSIMGSGREFSLFDFSKKDVRGGSDSNGSSPNGSTSTSAPSFPYNIPSFPGSLSGSSTSSSSSASKTKTNSQRSYRRNNRTNTRLPPRSAAANAGMGGTSNKSVLTNIKEWIQAGNLPKIQCRVEPNTTLKVRKTFRPLKTVVRLGADFNTQLGVWQFKSSWEDDVIGGKLTLAGRELQFSKTWLLSVGAVEDLVTRLRMRAAVDLGTMKAYARLGFRTERLSPINVVEGFTLRKRLPLDGNYGHVKLEVKANFAFPEPEIEYSTENHRSFVGMGDIEVNIDELNLLLDY